MFENIGENLSAMISIPTVSGAGNEPFYHIEEYRNYLRTTFQTLFTAADITPVGEALLLKLRGTGSRLLHEEKTPGTPLPVLFTGHMDVVPAADEASWKFPPFSGRIADGCVWGRGSQDMKGPQCALLSAFESLLEEGWRPKRDIWLYLSCDEETGGFTTGRAAKL